VGFIALVLPDDARADDTVPAIHGEESASGSTSLANPATGRSIAKEDGRAPALFAKLYDITGKLVMEKTARERFFPSTSGLVPCHLYIRISNGYGIAQATEKITIL